MTTQSQARLDRLLGTVSAGAAVGSVLLGGVVLAGWVFDIEWLKSVHPAFISMKANTAVGFILTGISLWLSQARWQPRYRSAARGSAAVVAALGLFTLVEYASGGNLGIDELLLREPAGGALTIYPGRMAPNTAFNFLLLGLSLLLLDVQTRRGRRPARYLIGLGAFSALASLLGYLYGASALYRLDLATNPMSLPAALAGVIAFLGLWLARPAPETRTKLAAARQGDWELLRQQREWLRVTLSSIGDAVLAADTAGHITFLNPVAAALTGWEEQEALGQPVQNVFRIINEATREPGEDIAARVLREGRAVVLANHTALVARDGREVPIEDSAAPITDSDGAVSGVVLVFHDVTQKRIAQETLRKSEERLTFALETSHTGAWDLDLGSHSAHRSVEHDRIFGYSQLLPQWTYEMFLEHVLPEDRPAVDAKFRHAVETGTDWSFECRIRRADQQERWIWAAGQHRKDASGAPRSMTGIVQDITDRKRTEAALRESERQFRTLADSIPNLAWWANADGYITWYNRRWYEYTGTTPQQMEGWGWQSVHDPQVLPAVLERWNASVAIGQTFDMTFPLRGADGVFRPFLTRVMPLKDAGGRVQQWFGTNTDVSEKEKAEENMRRLNAELEQRVAELQAANQEVQASRRAALSLAKDAFQARQEAERVNADLQKAINSLGSSREAALNLMDDAVRARHQAEQATADSRSAAEQRRLALEAADLGAWDYHFQTGEVFWDERCRAMWGIPQGEKIDYAGAIAAIHPDDQAGVDEAVRQALAGRDGSTYHREFRVFWPDGSVRWIASHGRVYFQGEGEERRATRFIGANQDTTERRQREEQLHKLNRTLRARGKSDQALLRATSESEYLETVCRLVVEDCGQAMVWVGFAEEDEAKTVRPIASAGFEAGYLETLHVTWADTERGRGPTGTAIRTGKPCACTNMLTDPAFAPWRQEALKRGYASSLVLPLLAEGRAFGALTIYSKEAEAVSPDELKLLTQLADDVAYCIGALRQRAARARAERRTELLAETASRLLGTDLAQSVVEDLCQKVLAFLDCQAFFNYLVDERSGRLHLNACAGISAEETRRMEWLDFGSAVCGCAARDGCRIVAEDIQHTPDPRTEFVKSYGIQAYVCHPLMAEGRVLGTVSFGTRTRTRFMEEEVSLMKAVSDLVSIAMERQRAQAALRQINEELEQRVTERTAELHAASRYARSLLEASVDPLVTISPAGKITDVNEATELATGLARDRLIGSDFSSCFTEPAQAEAGYQKVLAEGLVRDYALTIRHSSGRAIEVLYNATLYRDEAGVVKGVFAAARDITDRIQAERRRDFTSALLALFAQQTSVRDYLKSVVEVIRQWTGCQALGIRIADEQDEIPYAAWAGFEPEFLELEHRLSLQRDCCCCLRAISQAFEQADQTVLTPAGSYRCDDAIAFINKLAPEERARYRGTCMKFGFASLAVILIRYREEAIGAVHLVDRRVGQFPPAVVEFLETMTPLIGEAVHRFQMETELARHRDQLEMLVRQRTHELTDANVRLQQTADDLQRSNRDLEQFAYVASHDLQEPLRAVGGYVKLLQLRFPDKLDDKARDYIAGAFDGATRMERLISDLLAYSRVGTRGGAFAPTNLDIVLEQALRNLAIGISASQAAINHDPLPTLTADATQMMQLFQNLIGNAIKFHGKSPPRIHVGAQKQQRRWVFSVRDNGIGIEPQYYDRIFQIFQRLHTRKAYSGTGIGLAICKKIVERHGGTIWVESQPGQGSTFYFSIPEAPT